MCAKSMSPWNCRLVFVKSLNDTTPCLCDTMIISIIANVLACRLMEGEWRIKIGDTEYSGDWVDRLAAYEETGLEPEELAQAEKKGRLVVLPCDVEDTVYVIDPGDYEHEYKPYVRLKTVSEINWKATRKKDLGWGLILAGGNCGSSARYKLNNVGKTVFLTREAAEAALDAMGGENNA